MPLAAPIGSGLGIRNPYNLRIILERAKVPIIVDAGVGTASDAAIAMELGCDGVLMNTAIAGAKDPLLMAEAMREAVSAGRKAFRAGRMPAQALRQRVVAARGSDRVAGGRGGGRGRVRRARRCTSSPIGTRPGAGRWLDGAGGRRCAARPSRSAAGWATAGRRLASREGSADRRAHSAGKARSLAHEKRRR